VFEDTRHLIQSAIDGYNVCIFAYGQTGSGKTHTIYGSKAAPGLTPRGVKELFNMLESQGSRISANVTLYMLELYQVRARVCVGVGVCVCVCWGWVGGWVGVGGHCLVVWGSRIRFWPPLSP